MNNQLPLQEIKVKLFELGLHFLALHSTRKALIESELSNKLKLRIRKNMNSSGNIFLVGEEVFYKCDNAPEWREPRKE